MSTSTTPVDLGLLAIRAGVGGTLAAHGAQKLFGLFGGHGITGTAGAMESMGFTPGRPAAIAAGAGETGGGLLLALGLATPAAGAAAGAMIAAAAVHKPAGFFAMGGGYEYPAILGLVSAGLAVTGPGGYSVDSLLGGRLNRPWMSAVALATTGAVVAGVLASRTKSLAAVPAEAVADAEAADAS